ncbi:MAG: geranylgeranylglyceryl/heptaprenylglyceryl phosphate synthase [Candidatus Caldarchaeum sp.]|nr:geranylgeranylglyceryl/heptaprenylglyceryl phosphate synthase [Candidatus Caldarchaeales archaeon]
MKQGRVDTYIHAKLEAGEKLHMTLIDPISISQDDAASLAASVEEMGSDAIMVGGSTVHTQEQLDTYIKTIKSKTRLPVIIFPNNVQSISRFADAIWFMSLLNSVDWYYIVGAHLQGALTVKHFNLEALPMGYVVFGHESTVAAMGRVLPLSPHNVEIAVCYGLAAQYLGMRYLYLEAGSGAAAHIPPQTIRAVKHAVEIPVIVGGGIRTGKDAETVAAAGADIIVTGTAAEKNREKLAEIIHAVKSGPSGL